MDIEPKKSPQIIDHRAIAKHGVSTVLGAVLGWLVGHSPAKYVPDPQSSLVEVTSTALDRGIDFWAAHLDPKLWRMPHEVLFDKQESTLCGPANAQTGPFYCPPNERIYLDLNFLRDIKGDLARAYVTAHELGHHIQKLRGEFDGRSSIAIELEADCYAGMWMHDEQQKGLLATGDLEAALAEAAAIGDDRLCPTCTMEQWTHGSSSMRVEALTDGMNGACAKEMTAR